MSQFAQQKRVKLEPAGELKHFETSENLISVAHGENCTVPKNQKKLKYSPLFHLISKNEIMRKLVKIADEGRNSKLGNSLPNEEKQANSEDN